MSNTWPSMSIYVYHGTMHCCILWKGATSNGRSGSLTVKMWGYSVHQVTSILLGMGGVCIYGMTTGIHLGAIEG